MKQTLNRPALILAGVLTLAAAAAANVASYVQKPDAEFTWTKAGEQVVGKVKVVDLKVRSQVWRGIPWDHTVRIFLPPEMKHPKTAVLFITGGNPGASTLILGTNVSQRLGAPTAILFNIPNQPLFDGKSEDDLIAHTFQEYLKSGDETWPLLFPMTKSAVRAMDAVQAVSKKEWPVPVEDFVVTGASKRGWTTYLTGAVDRRVRGIAPMVFDNLNFAAQMPRQLELWGRYSEQIEDYTRRGLQQQMSTERGKKLVSMVDPWFYRKQLTMPKLLIHGANDRYWATDAVQSYWDGLPGEKHLLAIPNAGHGLEDQTRLLNTISAFFHAVASDRKLPELTAGQREEKGAVTVEVTATAEPKAVRLWTARASDLDFRPVKWDAVPATGERRKFRAEVPGPGAGGLAVFAEAEFEADGRTYTLTTPTRVYGTRKPAAAAQ